MGHWKGAEALSSVIKAAAALGIRVVTVYAFSTENWLRPREEVNDLMALFKEFLTSERESMVIREGVKVETIGNIRRLPEDVLEVLEEAKSQRPKDRDSILFWL